MCVVATIDSIRHTLDAPALLEYVPATQEVHVADELAPVALEYVPASQEAHVDAPAHTWCVRESMGHTRHAGRHEERQQSGHGHPPVTRVTAPPPHTITLARTTHALARHT